MTVLLAEQVIQISLEMLLGFMAFIIVVIAIPTVGFLWNISNKMTRLCMRIEQIEKEEVACRAQRDDHAAQLQDHHDQLMRLQRTPPNVPQMTRKREQ